MTRSRMRGPGWMGIALVLLLAAGAQAAPGELRGLLVRRKPDDTPRAAMSGEPSILQVLADEAKAKILELGGSRLSSVGSRGYYGVKLRTDGLLGNLIGGLVERALPLFQEALATFGLEVLPDYGVQLNRVPDDQLYSDIQAAMSLISADRAWDITTGDPIVKVCVIDTGIDFTHPDLAANMPDQLVYNAITNEMGGPDNDDDGHGTHVAGTIGAVANNARGVAGVSWNVHIIGCKFLGVIQTDEGPATTGNNADAAECVRWCRDQGAWITSNSWGGVDPYENPALIEEMIAAEDAGMLFIAAAGNEAVSLEDVNTGPGEVDLPSVINVGAVDNFDQTADFSNFGRTDVDLFAPGVDIMSTAPGGDYQLMSGTSMACPHVSGAAALLWSYMPGASAAQIKAAILNSVDMVPGAAESVTGGRLNVMDALTVLSSGSFPPPDPDVPAPSCEDSMEYATCAAWRTDGACEGATVYNGQLVYVLCGATCNMCDRCEDLRTECASWQQQDFCDRVYEGWSVGEILCRKSCGACGGGGTVAAAALESFTLPRLDISGVWVTSGQVDLYIKADVFTGKGYATWLQNPPQSMRVASVGGEMWQLVDVAGDVFQVQAAGDAGQATNLTVGLGESAVTWTRKEGSAGQVMRYVIQEGDTLDGIASNFSTTAEELVQLNPFLGNITGSTLLPNLPVLLPGSSFDGPSSLFAFAADVVASEGTNSTDAPVTTRATSSTLPPAPQLRL